MNTKVLMSENEHDIALASEILKNGGLVAIPTETVYGLAANALDSKAVKAIFAAKGRPCDNPLIVHISKLSQLEQLVKEIPETALKLAKAFWPGPLTMIFKKSDIIPLETSGGLDTVAVRFPSNKTALKIIDKACCPLAAPSANISGKPSPTTFKHVCRDLSGRVDAIVDGGDCEVGLESTVISLTADIPRVLRPGGITLEQLKNVIGNVIVDSAVLNEMDNSVTPASPGMKYKHYSPKADIIVSELSFNDYINLVNNDGNIGALCFEGEEKEINASTVTYGKIYDSESQAHNLFTALHELDEKGIKKIYARAPQKRGVGLAVYNRLIRAAGFNVIKPEIVIVGLTGQTGAGKTTVAAILQEFGACIIDCDKVSKDTSTYTRECMRDLQNAFGCDIISSNGDLNRRELALRAFKTPEKNKLLNNITLPVISRKINLMINVEKAKGQKLIILDAPTLFEANADRLCAKIIVVVAKEKTRIKRIMKRDDISMETAVLRIKTQNSEEFFVNRADMVIDTTTDKDLRKEVRELLNKL